MNISKYLLLILSFILFVVNFFRTYIALWGWNKLGRMPAFEDALKILKPIFISWQVDENLLLAAHFLTTLLILIVIPLFTWNLVKGNKQKWLIFPLLIVEYEILFRCMPCYEYVMFD